MCRFLGHLQPIEGLTAAIPVLSPVSDPSLDQMLGQSRFSGGKGGVDMGRLRFDRL